MTRSSSDTTSQSKSRCQYVVHIHRRCTHTQIAQTVVDARRSRRAPIVTRLTLAHPTAARRQPQGGDAIVWAGISRTGNTVFAFLDGKQRAIEYANTLKNYLVPPNGYAFKQDNAAIYTARYTQEGSLRYVLTLCLGWHLGPDFNRIENVWGVLTDSK